MIEVRARADFRADFPDDGVEDETGWVEFPGRSVATAIAEMLRRIGCAVAGPIQADEHGWELVIEFKQESLWCQVTAIDDYTLLFTDGVFMGNSSSRPGYLEAIAKLNLEMQRDPRFHDVLWYRWRGPEGPGSSAPLDVAWDRLPRPAPRRRWFAWGKRRASDKDDAH